MANKNKNENLVDISSNKQVRKLYKKKGRGLRIVTLVLSILMLLTGSAFVGLNLYLETHRKFEGDYTYMKDDASGKQTANTGNTVTLKTSDLLQNSKVLNIMLFGEDNKLDEEFGRTDTIIMLSIDNVHKKLKMTSFQRDTYVYIPGHGYERINASYSLGGAALTIKTIQANFGVKIDRYAVVDFDSFNTITAKPGLVKLNGQEALWYSRNRGLTIGEDGNEIGISGDDWDRTARQRKLLTKMVHDLKGAGLSEIIAIVNEIGPKITTNLKKDEIMGLVTNALTYIDYDIVQNYVPSEKLWYYNGPGDESYEVVGSCILVTDMEAQRKELAQFIYEDLVK